MPPKKANNTSGKSVKGGGTKADDSAGGKERKGGNSVKVVFLFCFCSTI